MYALRQSSAAARLKAWCAAYVRCMGRQSPLRRFVILLGGALVGGALLAGFPWHGVPTCNAALCHAAGARGWPFAWITHIGISTGHSVAVMKMFSVRGFMLDWVIGAAAGAALAVAGTEFVVARKRAQPALDSDERSESLADHPAPAPERAR